RVMSLQDPIAKMSKSDENPNAYIGVLDEPNVIMRKFKRAVTDSDMEIRYDEEKKPGVSNLMSIYSSMTGKSFDEIENEFDGKGYGDPNSAVGQSVVETIKPTQDRYKERMDDKSYLDSVMKDGAQRASYIANKTLRKVYKKVGLIPRV